MGYLGHRDFAAFGSVPRVHTIVWNEQGGRDFWANCQYPLHNTLRAAFF